MSDVSVIGLGAVGVSTEIVAPMRELMKTAVAAGYDTADLSILVELIKESKN